MIFSLRSRSISVLFPPDSDLISNNYQIDQKDKLDAGQIMD
jgi:hypothetical protein